MDVTILNELKRIADKHLYLDTLPDGKYEYTIVAYYNDRLRDKVLEVIFEADDPRAQLSEKLKNSYDDSYIYDFIEREFEKNWSLGDYEDYEEEVMTWMQENIYIEYPDEHYLKQEVNVNITVDTGDGNQEFTLNSLNECTIIDEESSLLWLVRQQGYKKSQLNRAVKKKEFGGSKLLESIVIEVENTHTDIKALTFLVKMTLGEVFDLMDYEVKHIKLNEHCNCGLYSKVSGAGGLFEIILEKPVTIPLKYVTLEIDGINGYGIRKNFGFCEEAWKKCRIS